MLRTSALVILLAACGNSGPTHWKDQPLEAVTGTTNGHAYSIQLPKGMQKSKGDSKWGDEYQYHQDGRAYAPMLTVSWEDKKDTLESQTTPDRGPFLDKGSDASGWYFVTENSAYKGKSDYTMLVSRSAGDGAFSCSARVYPMVKGEDVKGALVPLVLKMCQSIQVK
jgi:hypothetical protein